MHESLLGSSGPASRPCNGKSRLKDNREIRRHAKNTTAREKLSSLKNSKKQTQIRKRSTPHMRVQNKSFNTSPSDTLHPKTLLIPIIQALQNVLPLPLAAEPPATLPSTLSLCCRFFRCTSKFPTVVSGPGVYSLPGQSWHRMRGRYMYFTPSGVGWPAGGAAQGSSVAVLTAE